MGSVLLNLLYIYLWVWWWKSFENRPTITQE